MLKRIFPSQIDNRFRGQPAALWLMFLLAFVSVGIALVAIFRPDGGAQSADGIPLDTYGAAASQAVIGVVAILGLAKLWTGLFSVMTLVRYRSLIPLAYLILVVDFVLHRAIGVMKPIVREGGHPGGYVTWVFFGLSVIGMVLAMTGKQYKED